MHPIVLIAFILSGFSSLTLETIWIRYLEHVFGATTLAVSTVLTCFMGGLALGSWLFGKYADRIKQPVVAYAVAEGVVGVCAFVIPLIIHHMYPSINSWMSAHLGNNFMLFSLVRFIAVAFVLIVPATCMGATLPLLSRHFMRNASHMKRIGQRIGLLYTVNTIGAVLGVFGATFILLKTIGLWATNVTAGVINLSLCAVIVWYRNRLIPTDDADAEAEIELDDADGIIDKPVESYPTPPIAKWFVMAAFFLSGLASMNLQVVWNRAMAMIIGSSVYSFAIVLIAFLVGLALGSAVFSKLSKRLKNPVFILGLVELFIAALAMLSYLYIDDLPKLFARMVTANINDYEEHVGLVQFIMFVVASLPVVPVTFGMGATFPLTIKAISSSIETVGKDVGSVYALNTLGAICGSFLSAFVFVPLFSRTFGGAGMQTSYFLSLGIYVAVGLSLLLVMPRFKLPTRVAMVTPAAVLAVLFLFYAPGWDPAKLTIGVFRISLMEDALDEESWGAPDIKYYFDGVTTTVSIEMWGRHIALKNNGKVDASNGDDMPTQVMVSAYPLLFHPKGPKDLDVAIVGYGSGVTVGAALEFPVKHVDCVELESAVIEASSVFGGVEGAPAQPEFDVNHLVYRNQRSAKFNWIDPDTFVINDRLKIFANDGRNFLASSKKKYDVIISEPSNPWITGVSNMFTRDAFESSSRALKEDGVFGQWVQLYEMSPENIKTIFRTFAAVYPHVMLFSAEDLSSDTVLLGSFKPLEFNLKKIDSILTQERVRKEMNRAYIFSATDVFSRVLLADRDEVLAYTNGPDKEIWHSLPINTDDNAYIEFAAPKDLISFRKYAGYLATIYTSSWKFGKLSGKLRGVGQGDEKAVNLSQMAISLLMNGRKKEAAAFVKQARRVNRMHPDVELASRMLALLQGRAIAEAPVFEDVEPAAGMTRSDIQKLNNGVKAIYGSLEKRAYQFALGQFLNIPEKMWRMGGPAMLHLKGYLHFRNASPNDSTECEDAIDSLTELAREHEGYVTRHPDIFYYLGLCHDNALNFDKAVKNTRTYVELQKKKEANEQIAQAQQKANLDAMLSGMEGTALIMLPADASDAPTTDAPGESPKFR
ncbi:MAG: fused MFS/spermidine synthase [Deltaproteobacteria bacterium]|nr:fused MFS/spermidine synthase [Deltaproteobacteria bacterium]MBN2672143.1 fused MFS/spermidine synthase [Deltaproteobacteria bacterium]